MAQDSAVKIVCVKIAGAEKVVRAFLSKHPMEPNSVKHDGESVVLEVCAPEQFIKIMEDNDLKVEVMFDATARGRERQKEVGTGNRFVADQPIPKGLGIRTKEEQK